MFARTAVFYGWRGAQVVVAVCESLRSFATAAELVEAAAAHSRRMCAPPRQPRHQASQITAAAAAAAAAAKQAAAARTHCAPFRLGCRCCQKLPELLNPLVLSQHHPLPYDTLRYIRYNSKILLGAFQGAVLSSTCDSPYHSRHRIRVDRHYLMFRTIRKICIQYTAINIF